MAILKKTTKDTNSLDAMRAQRDDLQARLAATEAQAREADPVTAWEELSRLATEAQVIERALSVLAQRIEDAERQQRTEQAEAVEAARAERRRAAYAHILAIAEEIAQQAQTWQAGILADLDAAQRELIAVGGYPPAPVGPALVIRRAVGDALQNWRGLAPEWVGLPTPPTAQELALAEARRNVARSEGLLENVRKMAREARHGGATPPFTLLETHAHGLAAARQRLLALEHPEITDEDEIMRRVTTNLGNELGSWLERYYEGKRQAAFLAQQQTQAAGGLLA